MYFLKCVDVLCKVWFLEVGILLQLHELPRGICYDFACTVMLCICKRVNVGCV